MANTLTNLQITAITDAALEAFTATLAPLRAFSLNASPSPVAKGNTVKVLSVPAQSAAIDFAGTYTIQDASASGVDVTINKHKFVSWGLGDKEVADQSLVGLETFGRQKGFQLASAVLADIWSIINNANYGAAAKTADAADFSVDDVIDLRGAAAVANWPNLGRSLILDSAYVTNILKDMKDASAVGSTQELRQGTIGSLSGFDIYESTVIPANAEKLKGFIVLPDAMLVAMRYLIPQEGNKYHSAEAISDPDTGLTMGYREWYSEDTGTRKAVLECNYGYLKGKAESLKRIVSAT